MFSKKGYDQRWDKHIKFRFTVCYSKKALHHKGALLGFPRLYIEVCKRISMFFTILMRAAAFRAHCVKFASCSQVLHHSVCYHPNTFFPSGTTKPVLFRRPHTCQDRRFLPALIAQLEGFGGQEVDEGAGDQAV